jgi:hypothetical protein
MLVFLVPAMYGLDSGAESAAVNQRATPWVSEMIGWSALKGGGRRFLRPFRAEMNFRTRPGALPRAGMLRAVGAFMWRNSRKKYSQRFMG